MIGLTSLEVYNSIFNNNYQNNKFELYKSPDSKSCGVSYEKVTNEVEKDLEISDNTATNLQDEIQAPNIKEDYREQVPKRMQK